LLRQSVSASSKDG